MPKKLKSAPPRILSKRTNAIKEIEAWIQNDNEHGMAHDVQRVSGKLSDNVTEQRLLRAKLLDLGKERYKFLVQSTYEKQMFIERQKKKAGSLKIYSSSAHFPRRKSKTKQEEDPFKETDTGQPNTTVVDQPIERQSSVKQIGFTSIELSAGLHIQTGQRYTHSPVKRDPNKIAREQTTDVAMWAKQGKNLRRKVSNDLVKDPRYVEFKNALYPSYVPDQNLDVSTIVQNIGSLHIPPKMPKHRRDHLGEKMQVFMKERGIVF